MNNKLNYEDVNKIIENYIDNDAKTWEIGTDFYKSMMHLSSKINKKILNKKPQYIRIQEENTKICFDKRYKLFIDTYEICCSERINSFAQSTIRQYLQEGSALSFFNYESQKITDNQKIEIMPDFYTFIEEKNKNLDYYILCALIRSCKTKVNYEKNLGFTLFLSLLHECDPYIFKNLKNYKIVPRTKRNKLIKENINNLSLNDDITIKFIEHIKGIDNNLFKKGKSSYVTACKELLKSYSINEIINSMINYINCEKFDLPLSEEMINNVNKNNLISQLFGEIDNKRSALKKNILNERFGGEKWTNDTMYTELENTRETPICMMDASHIYDVNLIKKSLKNYITNEIQNVDSYTRYDPKITELLYAVDDHQNGLMLTKNMHTLFDCKRFWFDKDGYLICRQEYESTIKDELKNEIKNIRIKKQVLSNRMKDYISLKNQLLKI